MSAARNDQWQHRIKALLREGYGAEDIAIKIGSRIEDVRLEISILLGTGELARLYERMREAAE